MKNKIRNYLWTVFAPAGLILIIYWRWPTIGDVLQKHNDIAELIIDIFTASEVENNGLACLIIGLSLLALSIISCVLFLVSKGTRNLIITSKDFGSQTENLDLPFWAKFSSEREDRIVFDGLSHCDEENGKEKIKEGLHCSKRINFLGIAEIPLLVYAGFLVGENGTIVSYYHYDRSISRTRKIKKGKPTNVFLCEPIEQRCDSTAAVLMVSTSFEPSINEAKCNFPNCDLYLIRSESYGKEILKTTGDIDCLASEVRKTIGGELLRYKQVNLLLSCSSEACFAIGTKLVSPALPAIKVFHRDSSNQKKPWSKSIGLKR